MVLRNTSSTASIDHTTALVIDQSDLTVGRADLIGNIGLNDDSDRFRSPFLARAL